MKTLKQRFSANEMISIKTKNDFENLLNEYQSFLTSFKNKLKDKPVMVNEKVREAYCEMFNVNKALFISKEAMYHKIATVVGKEDKSRLMMFADDLDRVKGEIESYFAENKNMHCHMTYALR